MSDFNTLFGDKKPIRWFHYLIHLGYYLPYWIKFFFSEPFKEKKRDLNILDTVQSLLESETTDENIKKSKELTHLHRIVENTKARRRLEKWSLRVIAVYLFTVLCIVLASYVSIPRIKQYFFISIPDSIMITILSTTTVNIIGLGLIVLRGHFLANDKSNEVDENSKNRENK